MVGITKLHVMLMNLLHKSRKVFIFGLIFLKHLKICNGDNCGHNLNFCLKCFLLFLQVRIINSNESTLFYLLLSGDFPLANLCRFKKFNIGTVRPRATLPRATLISQLHCFELRQKISSYTDFSELHCFF